MSSSSFNLNKIMPWIMVFFGALFYAYESLLRQSPSVMNADIMSYYKITASSFAHLVAYYYYIYAPMQLFIGLLMDKYGAKRLLTGAAFVCASGTYLFIATKNILIAELGRFLVGLGSSFAFVGVLKIASNWLPPERFAIVTGSTMAIGMLGCLFGDIFLTSIVNDFGWRGASFKEVFFGFALASLMFVFLKDKKVKKTNISFKVLIKNCLHLFKNKQIWMNGFIGCLTWLPIAIFAETWGVFYLENVYHMDKLHAGQACSMVFLGWAIGGPISGFISDKLGTRKLPIMIGSALAGLLVCLILYFPEFSGNYLFLLLFLFGLFNSVQAIVFAVSRELSAKESSATALAVTNMFVMVSGILQPITGYLLDYANSAPTVAVGLVKYSSTAYTIGLSVLPVGLFISAFLAIFLQETFRSDSNGSHY